MIEVSTKLVVDLIAEQFPHWSALPIHPVANGGWDNRSFRLGDAYVLRLPSAAAYAGQVDKEQAWLPVLAPQLPLAIPTPVAKGAPGRGYPFFWSVYRWLPGKPAASATIADRTAFAERLAGFVRALHHIDPAGAPAPGDENYFRGGSISHYDAEARDAIDRLEAGWPKSALLSIWEEGAGTVWSHPPLWVHGDMSPGNLLVDKGVLSAVIDFGQLCVGDPACDFAIGWSFFDAEGRRAFRNGLEPDEDAWVRGRCWALWKAAILVSGLSRSNSVEMAAAVVTLDRILADA